MLQQAIHSIWGIKKLFTCVQVNNDWNVYTVELFTIAIWSIYVEMVKNDCFFIIHACFSIIHSIRNENPFFYSSANAPRKEIERENPVIGHASIIKSEIKNSPKYVAIVSPDINLTNLSFSLPSLLLHRFTVLHASHAVREEQDDRHYTWQTY